MRVGFHIYWFLIGFAVAAVVAAALQPESAVAQGISRDATSRRTPSTGGAARAPALRGAQPADNEEPVVGEDGDDTGAGAGDAAARVEAPADETGDLTEAGASAGAGAADGVGFRPSVRDGDLDFPAGPAEVQDGTIEAEPLTPKDGANPARVDMRGTEDIAAFDNPPAGIDPTLFQIEDVAPVRSRRIDRLARIEPYDATGIKVGGFVIFPQIEIVGVAQRNVLRSPRDTPDIGLDLRPSLRAVSNWNRHALEFIASGIVSDHAERPSEDDRAYRLEGRGRYDIWSRSNVQVVALRDVSQEGRQVLEAARAGTRSDITLDSVEASFNHRFNRLSVQLRGGIAETSYSDVWVGSAAFSNADRNFRRGSEAVRTTWEFKPTLSAFVEVGLDQRSYRTATFADGILRSSTGERFRVGVSFGSQGAILRGEASVGWGQQAPDDRRLETVSGVIVDANLAWKVTGLTTVSLKANSDFLESNLAGTAGSLARQGGVEVRHAFRPWLVATAGLTYTATDYAGVRLSTQELDETAGVEYYLNREWTALARYRHTDYTTTALNANYSDDEVRFGMRWRR